MHCTCCMQLHIVVKKYCADLLVCHKTHLHKECIQQCMTGNRSLPTLYNLVYAAYLLSMDIFLIRRVYESQFNENFSSCNLFTSCWSVDTMAELLHCEADSCL